VGRGGDGTGTGDGAAAALVQVVESPPSPLPAPPVVVAARVLSYVQPRYPESARDRGIEGVVRCECDVLCDGSVGDVRVVESSGFASLDAAAVAVVKRWTFAAATSDGVAFESTITLPAIRFRLQ
jgi:protein TonB